ncbi:ABC transporter permease [Pseudooceanicola nanhaiensis]|uniref:ABC transporter permease n=1 Tax=Pseudooceanicola nanhaiensis TaxID=375761 RepID=UPI001CD2DF4D|nr:ABC transporter permease [Pseudooceanicola nanhaiensis]MCA0921543.1 ABC transporter permease [Pseudooceanicola nanhaiensis]
MTVSTIDPPRSGLSRSWTWLRRNPAVLFGLTVLLLLVLMAIFAPLLGTVDPKAVSPFERTQTPSAKHWFGTDMLGRDLWSRVVYGTRVSLTVGFLVAICSTVLGALIGVFSGFIRWVDAIVMRLMDGLMSIPSILLAIALITLSSASIWNVILAITIVETPRTVRLVRGVVLSLRDEPYVGAAQIAGISMPGVIFRHILPNTFAPLLVQATYICAVAIISEASLSFIGAGVPPSTPSWGNIMAEGRALWQIKPHIIAFPAIALSITVLAINMLGDGLRDALDPRMSTRRH